MNVRVLEQILTSDVEYWIFKKRNTDCHNIEFRPSIFMAVIPINILRFDNREDIKLIDLEGLVRVCLDGNIFLNEDYPPFQMGQDLHDVIEVYPIICNSREFLIKAMQLKSDNIRDYKNIIDEIANN